MKDKEEGTEVENKFLDCNWSPKFVNRYIRNCNSGMAALKKTGKTATRQGNRITLMERKIWENPNHDGSAKCYITPRKKTEKVHRPLGL
jgi:hypothetical protein